MEDGVIDLRQRALPGLPLAVLFLLAPFVVAVLVAAIGSEVEHVVRVGSGALGGVLVLAVLLGGPLLQVAMRPHRLIIDDEGIRLEDGGRRPAVRLAWSELEGVGLVVNDPVSHIPPMLRRYRASSDKTLYVGLELYPAGRRALRRHPELGAAWRTGEQRRWLVELVASPSDPPPVAALVLRQHPHLWRGERTLWPRCL